MSHHSGTLFLKTGLLAVFFLYHSASIGQDPALLNNNKQVITRYFDQVINTHNTGRIREFFHEDYTWHTMDGKDISSNRDSAHLNSLKWLFTAIPDVQYTIVHLICQGDMVAVNTTATGTATSEMFGLPPAKKKAYFQQMFFFRLKSSKITEEWEAVDTGGLKARLAEN